MNATYKSLEVGISWTLEPMPNYFKKNNKDLTLLPL